MASFIRTIVHQEHEGNQIIVKMYSESDGWVILKRFIDDKLEEFLYTDGQALHINRQPDFINEAPGERKSPNDALSNAIFIKKIIKEIQERPLETLNNVLKKTPI